MNKVKAKAAIMTRVSKELDLWFEKSETIKESREYETELINTAFNITQSITKNSLGDVPSNRNKKRKILTCFGIFEISKSHVLCKHTKKFGISSKLQEIICYLASESVFEGVATILHDLLRINISAKQVQRVSEYYGQKLEELEENYQESTLEVPLVASETSAEPVYVTMDGSMVYTREEEWKEMKVGRIYSENSRIPIQKDRTIVMDSIYTCTFGNNKEFLKKLDPYIEPYKHKVFIADGAKWIWNWVETFYGLSVQILDFYHAVEKLSAYATLAYKDAGERRQWLDVQKQRLKSDEVEKVIEDLKNTTTKTTETNKALNDVIRYYENNIDRMKYGTFIAKGYLIGSGAIESAHRNVIQQRLKLSGQRWSIVGAQNIANLRAYKKSNRWETLIQEIKKAA